MTVWEFSKIYKQCYLPLCMYALRLLGDDAEARDVVQESFLAVWEKLEDGLEISDIKGYLYRTVYNNALSLLRKRRESAGDASELLADEPTEDTVDTSERDAMLWESIDSLPARCREVFLLSKRDGLSNSAIAERLGVSVKTVENQMTKAFSRLRPAIRRRLGSAPVFFLPFL